MTALPALPSRGLRGIAGGIFAGGISAVLFAVALMHAETIFITIAYLAAIPLFMAGLGAGMMSGILASAIGILGLLLTKPIDVAAFYAACYALPVAALIALTLHRRIDTDGKIAWAPEGALLTAITIYPCVIFLAVATAAASHDGGLLGITQKVLEASAAQFKDVLDASTYTSFMTIINQLARSLPALVGCSWMIVLLLSLTAAQGSLAQQKWNLRPSLSLQNIVVPTWMIFVAAATGLAGTFAPAPYNYIGTNLCVMLCVPFILVGIAVVHALAARSKAKWVILIVFYLILTVIVWTVLLVAALGMIDHWINFRQRFAAKPNWKKGGKI